MSDNHNLKIKTASGIFWQFFERIAAELVTLIVGIVLARFLMPSDYGTIALIEIFITIFSVFVTTGFGAALIQKKDTDELDYYSAFYSSITLGVILYIILFFCAPLISHFYKNEELTPIVRFMSLQLPILSIKSVETSYVAKHFMFKKFFFATLIGTVLSGVLGIFMALNGFGPWAICWQTISNMSIDVLALAVLIKKPLKIKFSLQRIKGLWKFASRMLLASVFNTVYVNLKKLIIGKKYTSEDLSFYSKGEQYPRLVADNISTTIESVFFPTLSKEQDDVQTVLSITRRFVQVSTYLMFPALIGLAAISNTLIPFLLTSKWEPCVIYLQIACIVYLFNPLQIATIQPIKAMGKANTYLIIEIIKKVVGLTLLIVVMNRGVLAIAIVSIGLSLINWLINIYPSKKLYNYSMHNQFADFIPNLLIAVCMGIVVFSMNYITFIPTILLLFLQIVAGICVYCLMSLITHNASFFYLIKFAKELKNRRV